MAAANNSMFKIFRGFTKRTEGSVTIEFILWVPVFMAVILLAADTSLVFLRQSNFWNVSRDTARIISQHAMDPSSAKAYARRQASFGGHTPDVNVTISMNKVTVTISGASKEMAPFGILGFAMGDKVYASITQQMEPI